MGLAWRESAACGPRDYFGGPVILVLALTFLLHLWLAYAMPMTNDEAYYWDWGQSLQLSYFDHPPGVSYLTWMSSNVAEGTLAARALSPVLYLLALCFGIGSLRLIQGGDTERLVTSLDARRSVMTLVILATFVPGLSLWGSIALPDTGLMFGLSATCYLALRFFTTERLGIVHGIFFGLALGVCGLFKYHALPVGGGMALGLMIGRFKGGRDLSLAFWVTAGLVGFYCCLPVWLWNAENNFASFRFQANHGFARPEFHLNWGLRILLAQAVLLGGVYWWRCLAFLKNEIAVSRMSRMSVIGLWGALPLLLLLFLTSFWKPLLPHWLLPAFWVLLPFVVARTVGKWLRWQWIMSIPLMAAVMLFSLSPVRERLVAAMNGKPGAMSEITVWPALADDVYQLWASESPREGGTGCESRPFIAGLRWYTTAQLRFYLPGHPKTLSLDPHHTSYYNSRDPVGYGRDCPVWVLVPEKDLNLEKLAEQVSIQEQRKLLPKGHEATPWVLVKGVLVNGLVGLSAQGK